MVKYLVENILAGKFKAGIFDNARLIKLATWDLFSKTCFSLYLQLLLRNQQVILKSVKNKNHQQQQKRHLPKKKGKTMSVKLATCLLMSMLAYAQADNCSFEEKQKLKLKHQKCTEVVQQRYSLLTVETPNSRKEVSTPLALKTNSGLEKEYVCRMIEETIDNCARIYDKCFNEKEMR